MELRKDYFEGAYETLTAAKLKSIQQQGITLKSALDLWWNSVRIDDNICYKTAYVNEPVYELGNLSDADLDRLIIIDHYDYDADGYPICFAEFINDENDSGYSNLPKFFEDIFTLFFPGLNNKK